MHIPRSRFSFGLALDEKRLIVLAGRLCHLEQQLIRRWLFDYAGRRVNCKKKKKTFVNRRNILNTIWRYGQSVVWSLVDDESQLWCRPRCRDGEWLVGFAGYNDYLEGADDECGLHSSRNHSGLLLHCIMSHSNRSSQYITRMRVLFALFFTFRPSRTIPP